MNFEPIALVVKHITSNNSKQYENFDYNHQMNEYNFNKLDNYNIFSLLTNK